MKKLVLVVTSVAALVMTGPMCGSALAQQPQMQAPAVAIIDITLIFKEHNRLKAMMNDLKQQMSQVEQELQKQKASYETLAQRLQSGELKRGSPEFKQLEEQLRRIESEVQVRVQSLRRDFYEQEAKMYHSIYQEVVAEVQRFCEQTGVMLVLRYVGDQADRSDPDAIYRDVNKSVVYHHKQIDITNMVLARLNANAGPPPATAPAGGAPVNVGPGNTLQPSNSFGPPAGVNPQQPINPGPASRTSPGIPPRR